MVSKATVLLCLVLGGCGVLEAPPSWLPETKGPDSPTYPNPNSSAPPKVAPPVTLLTTAIDHLTLPRDGADLAVDLFDSGMATNRLGSLLAAIRSFAPQLDLRQQVSGVDHPTLSLEIVGRGLSDDADAELRVRLATRQPSVAGAPLRYRRDGAHDTERLDARIASGRLVARGARLSIPLPLPGQPRVVRLDGVRISARVDARGVHDGRLAGALHTSEVRRALVPALAQLIGAIHHDHADLRARLEVLFDANRDGVITAAEVEASAALSLLLTPDVDSDGDGRNDALSLAVGFDATPVLLEDPAEG